MAKWADMFEGMDSTPLEMVREFGKVTEDPYIWKDHNQALAIENDWELLQADSLRFGLIEEEFEEVGQAFQEEFDNCDVGSEALLKELADLVYVVYGYAAFRKWDLDEAVKRVHESNMTKLDDNGKPVRNEAGKVTKGKNYKPPYLGDLV